ncbi:MULTISPECIES: hypothetical protein [unclassified Bradyrhizobium]|uniref:hypothetical protein n=1 Tax=unclassified Bradyrhizobium TaxID=2631580 RepID=UPI002478B3E4|nr:MULTISPECIES: hypothetical protein [unclassified Bradyrhizobium]WGR74343.1 hypothetical protein MTX24_16595 [Bradyrhizobium sp. ISRA426]WGR79178.1 hypothetical protein MTX21_01710 [Bradyrhizobium sp. ISRA430]WGR90599.1 hypothetical protein MTX25_39855 [Bradyrhizobium sp. ISRA432]
MPAFQWPLGKLELINSALSQTGDNLVNVADDGSDEWNTCSPAYERGLAFVCEDHSWSWLTAVRTLQPAVNAPSDDQFDTAYNLPADLVHLIWVRVNDQPTVWDLLNDQLVVNAQGGPPPPATPATPATVTVKGIFSTNSDPSFATPTAVLALQLFVMSGIYRGLHEDGSESDKMWQAGMAMLERAKSRHDMQKPKRALFNGRVTAARRIRRPWPPVPGGWSGTGTPG